MAKNRTVRKSSVRKATVRRLGTGVTPEDLSEEHWFVPDEETTARGKNNRLSELVNGVWNKREIVRIDRIEISERGWRATYRE
ncbi:MAG TPA: hypothetical protein VFD71_10440 [Planctomycetota bacterium]|nr:hypothetical protein [Planctomycetota bacterium]